jgi:hypothetical protein
MLVDSYREITQDILVQPLLPFHFGDRRGRRVDVHQGKMCLAVLPDSVGKRFEPPRLDLADRTAALLDYRFELVDKRFDLLAGNILPRQKYVLV